MHHIRGLFGCCNRRVSSKHTAGGRYINKTRHVWPLTKQNYFCIHEGRSNQLPACYQLITVAVFTDSWFSLFFFTNYCLRKRPANSKSEELLLAFKGRISLTPAILHSSISKQSVHYPLSTGTSHNRLLGFRVTLPPFEVSKETVSNPPDSKTFCCSRIWTRCMFTSLKET